VKRFVLSAVLAAMLLAPPVAAADDAAWMYDPSHVTEIDLGLSDASRAALDADPDEYVEATFSLTRDDATTYGPLTIGVKLKGHGSFRTLAGKAAFKLKFNEFVSGQKFLGLKKMTLNNMVQDATMLHEVLAYEAFRAAGLPASRTGYSYVRINDEDYGVYLNLETLDDVSLPLRHATTQHLYEGEFGVDVWPEDVPAFEVDEGDEDDRSDLEALVAATDAWADMDAVADLDQLTRFWAVEKYIGHWDGYSHHGDPNNYYLHSDEDGRFTMIPWGTDQTWAGRLPYDGPGGRLFTACLADAACLARYHAAVADVRELLGAYDLAGLASDTNEMLAPWRDLDPRKESTPSSVSAGLASLHYFLDVRPADTEGLPAEPTAPAPAAAQSASETPSTHDALPPPPAADQIAGGGDAASEEPVRLAIRAVTLRRGRLVARAVVPGPGALSLRATARIAGTSRRVCRATTKARAAGELRLSCRLARVARRRVSRGPLGVAVSVRFAPPGGRAQQVRHHATLRRR
jgi:hypothetical protein